MLLNNLHLWFGDLDSYNGYKGCEFGENRIARLYEFQADLRNLTFMKIRRMYA